MKRQKSEQKPWKPRKLYPEYETRATRLSSKKTLWMPEQKKCSERQKLSRNSDEYRRKTRSQVLREKQARAVNASLRYSEVSIQTLHAICAPAASQQATESLQKQQPSKSTAQHNDHLVSSSRQYLFHTSEVHPLESRLEFEAIKSPQPSNEAAHILPLHDTWLETFVEIDDGIDLVVDLDSNSTKTWFLERNSCMLVHPAKADGSQKRCGTNPNANDQFDVALFGSSSTEAPSTNTTGNNEKLTTICMAVEGDAGSKAAQLGIVAGYAPSCCKFAEVADSQDSSTSQVNALRNQGFNFSSLERMPTFLATGMRRPSLSVEESKVTCNSTWMVVYMEA